MSMRLLDFFQFSSVTKCKSGTATTGLGAELITLVHITVRVIAGREYLLYRSTSMHEEDVVQDFVRMSNNLLDYSTGPTNMSS
jgi:hypothetical protein